MDPVTKSDVTRLLKRGLNHYGLGDLEAAIACWERARSLDPSNQAVQDYLETAYEEGGSTRPAAGDDSLADPATDTHPTLPGGIGEDDDTPPSHPRVAPGADPDGRISAALGNYRSGNLLEAWQELSAIAEREPDRLEVRGYLELVRKQLMQQWAGEIGDFGRVLRLVPAAADLLKLKLKPEEAFLLSQVDGMVAVEDLLSLSSVDRFQTLQMIARFLRETILE